jgi:hypothetical protein
LTDNTPKRRISLVGLLQVVAFFTALFSLLSVAQSWHRTLELLAHFKLQLSYALNQHHNDKQKPLTILATHPLPPIGATYYSLRNDQFDALASAVNASNGPLPSWPSLLPFAMIPIDHCLVSGEFTVIDIKIGPDVGSDHLPLIVELGLH